MRTFLPFLVAPRDNTDPNNPPADNPPAPQGDKPEVDLSQYMPKALFEKELTRRVAAIVGKQKSEEDFLDDEAFRQKALEKWGVGTQPQGDKTGALAGEQLERAKKDWERQHVAPMAEKLTKTEARVQQLLSRDLHAQILGAAGELGVMKTMLAAPVEGGTPMIVNLLQSYFGVDEETGQWYLKEGDGFAYSATPTAAAPYKTPVEFLREWIEGPGKAFVEDTRQRGPGMGQPGGPGKPKDLNAQIAEAEAKGDFVTANRLKAEKLRSL